MSSTQLAGPRLDTDVLRDLYAQMVLIREFETETERQYKLARIGGYCHLSSGQEAATVGVTHAMRDGDALITGYRCHGFALAHGTSAEAVMAELFGRVDGCARGRGGSMHLLDVDRNYLGGWGIVAGQLPIATGVALAYVRQGRSDAVVCELGDGATNMGAWHESLNLAALWHLPLVFVVLNNVYGMGTSVERASAEPDLHKRAAAFRMHGERVDGNDVEAVAEAAGRLLERAREERSPSVLEITTYRFRGHSVADPGTAYRTKDEVSERRAHDPLVSTRALLRERGVDEAELERVQEDAREAVKRAVEFAESSPQPGLDELALGAYAPGSGEQFERMRPGSPFDEVRMTFDQGLGR